MAFTGAWLLSAFGSLIMACGLSWSQYPPGNHPVECMVRSGFPLPTAPRTPHP